MEWVGSEALDRYLWDMKVGWEVIIMNYDLHLDLGLGSSRLARESGVAGLGVHYVLSFVAY